MNLDKTVFQESLKVFITKATNEQGDKLIESVSNNPDFPEGFAKELEEIRSKKG